MQKRLLPLVALLLVGADNPDDEPVATDDSASGAAADDAPASSDEAPQTLGIPAQVDDGLTDGERALRDATLMLTERRWNDALLIAIPGVSQYPEQADSFQTIATIASDQIARGPAFNAPGAATAAPPSGYPPQPPPTTGPGSWGSGRPNAIPQDGQPTNPPDQTGTGEPDPYGSWRSPRWRDTRPHPAANDPREGLLVGFDAGLNNGLRVEWKAKGRVVDGVGLQAGLGTWVYSGLYLAPITQAYIDFQSRSDFQFETSLGILWYSGSAYPLIGIGGQWDPPKPIQVNVGVDVGLGIFPDVSVGFLW